MYSRIFRSRILHVFSPALPHSRILSTPGGGTEQQPTMPLPALLADSADVVFTRTRPA